MGMLKEFGVLALGFVLVFSCWFDGTMFDPPSKERLLERQKEREEKRKESWGIIPNIKEEEMLSGGIQERDKGSILKEKKWAHGEGSTNRRGEKGHEGGIREEDSREEELRRRLGEAKEAEKVALSSLLETEDALVSRLLKMEIRKLEGEMEVLNQEIQRLEESR